MMTMPQPPLAQWRVLGAAELAASAETKLGGLLAVVVMVGVVVLVMAWLVAFGDFFSSAMISRMLFSGSSLSSKIAGISIIPQTMFAIWAIAFVIMTMGRRPSTPKVASTLMVIWAATSIGTQIATRFLIAQNNFDVVSQASLVPSILIEIILVAAFCGYMNDGRRPNVYYLKRVRV